MNLSGLMDTVRNALGLGAAKPPAPAPRASAQTPPPAPRPAAPAAPKPAAVTPSPIVPQPVTPAPAASTGGATLVRSVRAGGKVLAVGTAVKIVATHGKGTAYTVQLPGVATAKTVEGAAIRVG